MQGDKNLIKFEGDHNSPRPQFYYDSVSIFFYNILHPPQFPSTCSNKFDKYYNLGAFKGGPGTNEVILFLCFFEIMCESSASCCTLSFSRLPIHPLNFQNLLYEIINGLRAAGTDAGSSSAATTNFTNGAALLS